MAQTVWNSESGTRVVWAFRPISPTKILAKVAKNRIIIGTCHDQGFPRMGRTQLVGDQGQKSSFAIIGHSIAAINFAGDAIQWYD